MATPVTAPMQAHPTRIAMRHGWTRWQRLVVDALDEHGPLSAVEVRDATDDRTAVGTAIVRSPATKFRPVRVPGHDPRPALVYVEDAIRGLVDAGLVVPTGSDKYELR